MAETLPRRDGRTIDLNQGSNGAATAAAVKSSALILSKASIELAPAQQWMALNK
jgi:hypothetical protein